MSGGEGRPLEKKRVASTVGLVSGMGNHGRQLTTCAAPATLPPAPLVRPSYLPPTSLQDPPTAPPTSLLRPRAGRSSRKDGARGVSVPAVRSSPRRQPPADTSLVSSTAGQRQPSAAKRHPSTLPRAPLQHPSCAPPTSL